MTENLKLVVDEGQHGNRLDEFLAKRLNGVSRMRIARLIADGGCLIDGEAAVSGRKMTAGECLEVLPFEYVPSSMTAQKLALEIVYEDEHIIVVVKASGVLVHPTMGVKVGTLANALTYHLNKDYFTRHPELVLSEEIEDGFDAMRMREMEPAGSDGPLVRPGIIHRLDRATSGLLVVAKTARALSVVSKHFRKGFVRKKYIGLVRGVIENDEGTIKAPIGRDADRRPHWWVMESGRQAETRWRVMLRLAVATLIELEPVTGRTNQLRIHCAWIGHPILGDALYDTHLSGEQPLESAISSQRLFLHAWHLAIHHPITGQRMQFGSALPADLVGCMERIVSGSGEEELSTVLRSLSGQPI